MIEKILLHTINAGFELVSAAVAASAVAANSILAEFADRVDEGAPPMTDREYCRHRLLHPVNAVVEESEGHLVLETTEGNFERWTKPMWRLAKERHATENIH